MRHGGAGAFGLGHEGDDHGEAGGGGGRSRSLWSRSPWLPSPSPSRSPSSPNPSRSPRPSRSPWRPSRKRPSPRPRYRQPRHRRWASSPACSGAGARWRPPWRSSRTPSPSRSSLEPEPVAVEPEPEPEPVAVEPEPEPGAVEPEPGDRILARRRVVQRIGEAEHPLEADAGQQRPGVEFGRVLGGDLGPHLRIAHRGDALVQRQVGDGAIGAGAGERVLAAGQPEQRADRTRRRHAADREAISRGLRGQVQQLLPRRGPVMPLVQREHQRTSAGLHDAPHHGEFGRRVRGVPVGGHLDEPLPGILQPHGDPHELGFLRAQRRGVVAGQRLVRDGAGGGEAESAGAHRIGGDFAHLLDVGLVRVLQVQRAVAHDVDAHRRMRQQRAEVDVVAAALQRGEVVGKTFPGPVEALVQAGAGDVLHAFHQRDDGVLGVLAHRGEADAAIAHHDGGHAVP